ncbi:hypothetical protein DDQ41_30130 [Streptomyces spongiicola]|uniref:Uncharacterized protein n=1 Tax=Streptomyces spongiicola TaxID=1690221 RepID=A0ABM6VE06_9ACTN|nr:hypothetical protein DDQ41_30130 [Streptomyces spongiicola]
MLPLNKRMADAQETRRLACAGVLPRHALAFAAAGRDRVAPVRAPAARGPPDGGARACWPVPSGG